MNPHAQKAKDFITNEERTKWHDESLWFIRQKRDRVTHQIPEWELLRELASQIKKHTLSHLDTYLVEFEENAKKNGVNVHWAADASEHNQIVWEILNQNRISRVVKSKSMLTEECGLNPFLESKGIEVVDTDLGEWIIQLRDEPPSHIVAPAIHLKKEEVGSLFHEKIGTKPNASDPQYLTESARQYLRKVFMESQVGITGVNFGIASTGGVVVVTNEGNSDMGVHLNPIQIHCMGIEKLIPVPEHLGIFTRLLARSATGQDLSIYTSHHHKPKVGGEMHIILVDNGRSEHLGREKFWSALKCIRCGACMNTCPVYRRSGGHSYSATIPGPIGSILTPGFNIEKYSDLPFASTLCGSCSDVCPVKINIHEQLYNWRQEIVSKGYTTKKKSFAMQYASKVLSKGNTINRFGKFGRIALKVLPNFLINNKRNIWARNRALPESPSMSFRDWFKNNE